MVIDIAHGVHDFDAVDLELQAAGSRGFVHRPGLGPCWRGRDACDVLGAVAVLTLPETFHRALHQLDGQVMLTVGRAPAAVFAGALVDHFIAVTVGTDGGRAVVVQGDGATAHEVHGLAQPVAMGGIGHRGGGLVKGEMKVMAGRLLNGRKGLGYSGFGHRVSPLGNAVVTWVSGCGITCWPVWLGTTTSGNHQVEKIGTPPG
jgi:hypothetical protein